MIKNDNIDKYCIISQGEDCGNRYVFLIVFNERGGYSLKI
jgi:hypothetical protein